ncbi:hypothetical protein AB0C13_38620 [Streptomyces sp. NPDC049099]|uniref:hypothetical protein n=1 Tax=Streptomyces sp. NPDC049099 TaxID=3155768 RepID=UPI003443E3F4
MCSTCRHRHRDSGLPYGEFVRIPRTGRAWSTENCAVAGCGLPRIDNGKQQVGRARWYQCQARGVTLERLLAGRLRRAGLYPGGGRPGGSAAV